MQYVKLIQCTRHYKAQKSVYKVSTYQVSSVCQHIYNVTHNPLIILLLL
jgi:hypothetical protein